mgnify:CR=1 FL=1
MADFIVEKRQRKEYEQFTCRIEVELLEEVKRTVLDNNLKSVNEFINNCIRYSLKNMTILDEEEKDC